VFVSDLKITLFRHSIAYVLCVLNNTVKLTSGEYLYSREQS